MTKLLIIADDFTGALDTGIKFAQRGIRTQIATEADAMLNDSQETEVLVLSLSTRHLCAKDAYATVYDVVKMAAARIPYIMKKTDSALRGNIGAELTAVLEASGEKMLSFLPAYPDIMRCTMQGVQYVEGKRIQESVFADDPFEPVLCSDVVEIIHSQSEVRAESFDHAGNCPDGFSGVAVFDGSSNEEMAENVRILHAQGRLRVVAGCAGLGMVLADELQLARTTRDYVLPSSQIIVACGSVNPISQKQMQYACACGIFCISVTAEQKLDAKFIGSEAYQHIIERAQAEIRSGKSILIGTEGTVIRAKNIPDDVRSNGWDEERIREHIADTLAVIVRDLMDADCNAAIMMIGGDTLMALMHRLHCDRIEPVYEIEAGVVLSLIDYCGKTFQVISKSGGFGGEDLIARLAGVKAWNASVPANK